MLDPSIVTNLGVSGLALWILWLSYKTHNQRMKEKDAESLKERQEFMARIDKRDEDFRVLNENIRNELATIITEASTTIKQGIVFATKRRRGTMKDI